MFFNNRKKELLTIIDNERLRLSPPELEILSEVWKRVDRNPDGFSPISDAQYTLLSENERSAANSTKRIDYIISKKIEYLLVSRKMSEKFKAWFRKNKVAILVSHAFGFAGAAFAFYLDHADKIDHLVQMLLSGRHFSTERKSEYQTKPIQELTPEELFAEQEQYPDVVQFLIELSIEGYGDPQEEDLVLFTTNDPSGNDGGIS